MQLNMCTHTHTAIQRDVNIHSFIQTLTGVICELHKYVNLLSYFVFHTPPLHIPTKLAIITQLVTVFSNKNQIHQAVAEPIPNLQLTNKMK